MKNKFPTLAAILLLATAATRADDLLDAVLWDGPSAFPSKAAPAPEPPPPPAPEPAPAPVYPSRSSYPLRPPAPEPAPPPAAPNSAAVESVPDAVDPVSHSGETQIRREIKEMRARADRLEAALGPSSAKSSTPAPIPVPSWTLSARGGVGSGESIAVHGELVKRLGDFPFDLALRGAFLAQTETRTSSYRETYYTYSYSWLRGWTSHEHSRKIYYDYDVDERNILGDLHLLWRPLRESHFSPYAGVGGRYEYRQFDGDDGENDNKGEFSLSGRVGLILYVPHFERLALKGEFIGASKSTELVGEVSLRLGNHFVLAAFVDNFDIDLGRATAFGGGLTLLF